jgi:O-antigen ligase
MINKLVLSTLIISVLLFGSVEVWSSAAVCFMIFTLGLIWILMREYTKYEIKDPVKLLLIAIFTFILYGAFQTIPLPASALGLISPVTFQLQSFYSLNNNTGAMPISFNTYQTLSETLRWAAFFTVFAISAAIFTDRGSLSGTLKTLTIFGFSLAIFAIIQKATWQKGIYWFWELNLGGVPFGPFVNRNHFAGLIGMLIPLGLGLALTQQTKEKKIFFGFMTVIMAVSLFFSLSRGGILSFFAGMIIFSLLIIPRDNQSKKVWLIGFFISIVLCYVIYLGIDPVIKRFYESDISGEERLVVWSATWNAIKDFWLTGSGLGSFINIFPLYSPPIRGGIYDHAHNDYLEFLLETGLTGAFFLLAFLALMIYTVTRNRLQGSNSVLRAAALSAASTMMVHSFFDFNLHILSNMLMFGYVLGMIAGISGIEDDTTKDSVLKAIRKGTRKMTASGFKLFPAGKKQQEPFFEGLGINAGENESTDSDFISEGKTEDREENRR